MPNNSVLPPEHFAYKTRPAGRSLSLANPCFRVPRAHFQSFSGGALDPMAKLQILGLVAILLAMVVWAEFQEKAAAATRFTAIDKYTTQGRQGNYGTGNLHPSQCPGQCSRRCSQTHHRKPCMLYCQKCCVKCLCVPPGFYGNKQVCPCYNNWKTEEGGPKCP